jgi:four helix bundle protein
MDSVNFPDKSKVKTQISANTQTADISARCYAFSVAVLKFVKAANVERLFSSLFDQLIRSATSVGANVAEAKSASSRKDFIRFYEYSLKSANETKYWLSLMKDALGAEAQTIDKHLQEITEISKILAANIIKLKRN